MKFKKLYLALLGAGLAGSGSATFAADATTELPSMVVSATRTEIDVKDSPASVSVITAEDIQQKTVFTVDEALKNTVGVMNRRTKGFMETTPSLTIRGNAQAKDNLVLVDGIPQNDSNNGQVNWTMIDTESVERIEVLRGPFSSLYGGHAMGGVVSIFTKMPEKSGVSMKLGQGGSLDSVAPEDFRDLALSGTLKATDTLALGMNYRKRGTAGYPTTHVNVGTVPAGVTGAVPYETTNSSTGNPTTTNLVGDTGDNWYEDDTVGFSLKFAPSDKTRLDLSRVSSKSEYGYDQPHTLLRTSVTDPNLGTIDDIPTLSTISLNSWLNGAVFARGGKAEQDNTGLTFRTAWNDLSTKIAIGQIDKHTETYIVGGTTPVISAPTLVGGDGRIAPLTDSKKTTVDVQFDLPLFDSHLLTFGVAGTRGKLENERWNVSDWTRSASTKVLKISDVEGEDENRALYLQDAYSINSSLTAYIGGRQDWWDFEGGEANFYNATGLVRTDTYDEMDASAFSPKLSLVYRPVQETTYRTSIGKAFRAPMLFELIQTSGIGGQTFIGNPDLDPETVTSWEIGVDHSFANGINAIATYYQSHAKDMIQTVTVTPASGGNPAEISPQNMGEADINGVELELRGPLPYGFSWSANYTYTDTEVTENEEDPELEGKQLVHVPKTQYNLGLDWRRDAWLVSANTYHQSKRYTRANNTDTFEDVPGATDPFTVTDVKATYQLSDKHSASLGVNNVFDKEYHQFYLSPGRFWFAELRAEY